MDGLVDRWKYTDDPSAPPRLPVKTVKYNRCPAVAPLGVMKYKAAQERLGLTLETIEKHRAVLRKYHKPFAAKVLQAVERLDAEREAAQTAMVDNQLTVDKRLYESFMPDADKAVLPKIRSAKPEELAVYADRLHDARLRNLVPLYKARNYPSSLDSQEAEAWETFRRQRLIAGGQASPMARYFARLQELDAGALDDSQRYLLEELKLYGESIAPV